MFDLSIPLWEIVLRTLVVYITVLALLRLGGKRRKGSAEHVDGFAQTREAHEQGPQEARDPAGTDLVIHGSVAFRGLTGEFNAPLILRVRQGRTRCALE